MEQPTKRKMRELLQAAAAKRGPFRLCDLVAKPVQYLAAWTTLIEKVELIPVDQRRRLFRLPHVA